MIEVRPYQDLDGGSHGWLETHHHFSFADDHDPRRMGWGRLRVWNDDEIAPRSGFPPHPHADMEIITYVREGAITHEDSLECAGDERRHRYPPGRIQSRGQCDKDLPDLDSADRARRPTGMGQKPFPKPDRAGQLVTLASGFAENQDALPIRTDARALGANLKKGQSVSYPLGAGRHAYLVPAAGRIALNGRDVGARDGAAIEDEATLSLTALEHAEIVLVDAA